MSDITCQHFKNLSITGECADCKIERLEAELAAWERPVADVEAEVGEACFTDSGCAADVVNADLARRLAAQVRNLREQLAAKSSGAPCNCHASRVLHEKTCASLQPASPKQVAPVVSVPLYVIFDGPPSRESGRFVEVETDDGYSMSVGKWGQRGKYWRLGPLYAAPPASVTEAQIEAISRKHFWNEPARELSTKAIREVLALARARVK